MRLHFKWTTGTGANPDIFDNNTVDSGHAIVTLKNGPTFESNGCDTWHKVG